MKTKQTYKPEDTSCGDAWGGYVYDREKSSGFNL
jgi:hypothetical protein